MANMIPKVSKQSWKITKDSKKIQKEFKRFQKVSKRIKRFQKNQKIPKESKDSKRIQNILENSKKSKRIKKILRKVSIVPKHSSVLAGWPKKLMSFPNFPLFEKFYALIWPLRTLRNQLSLYLVECLYNISSRFSVFERSFLNIWNKEYRIKVS